MRGRNRWERSRKSFYGCWKRGAPPGAPFSPDPTLHVFLGSHSSLLMVSGSLGRLQRPESIYRRVDVDCYCWGDKVWLEGCWDHCWRLESHCFESSVFLNTFSNFITRHSRKYQSLFLLNMVKSTFFVLKGISAHKIKSIILRSSSFWTINPNFISLSKSGNKLQFF